MRLDTLTFSLPNLKKWLGKEVILTVEELPTTQQPIKAKNWHMLGATTFAQNLDQTNIRNLAYED